MVSHKQPPASQPLVLSSFFSLSHTHTHSHFMFFMGTGTQKQAETIFNQTTTTSYMKHLEAFRCIKNNKNPCQLWLQLNPSCLKSTLAATVFIHVTCQLQCMRAVSAHTFAYLHECLRHIFKSMRAVCLNIFVFVFDIPCFCLGSGPTLLLLLSDIWI